MTPDPNQARFMQKLREKLQGNDKTPHPGRWRFDVTGSTSEGKHGELRELVDQFSAALKAVGGQATRYVDPEDAQRRLTDLCEEWDIRSVVLDQDPRWSSPEWQPWRNAITASVPNFVAAEGAHAIAGADAGVTLADWAIADTGTIVITTGPGRSRLTSLLPPFHIVLLPADRIRSTRSNVMDELRAASASGGWPANVVLITGPSRTADIEGDLSMGVHGPGRVYVMII